LVLIFLALIGLIGYILITEKKDKAITKRMEMYKGERIPLESGIYGDREDIERLNRTYNGNRQ
jgi:preprotein translocase subunit YajC